MKIQTLAAILLSSTLAIGTAYAADEAMPASGNMSQTATSTASTDKDKAMNETKKHSKKHHKHKKHHHKKAETKTADAAPADANQANPANATSEPSVQ
jgi:hypothetical protein